MLKGISFFTVLIVYVQLAFSGTYLHQVSNNTIICVDTTEKELRLPMSTAQWDCFDEDSRTFKTPGEYVFDSTGEGLKFYGSEYRAGSRISFHDQLDLANKTVYIKWKPNGNNNFTDFRVSIYYDKEAYGGDGTKRTDLTSCSTHNVYNHSSFVSDNTWYYTRLEFKKDNVLAVTASRNYDDSKGKVIQKKKTDISSATGYFAFRMGDTYSKSSFTVINEIRIVSNE
jgi:hypothetical protein